MVTRRQRLLNVRLETVLFWRIVGPLEVISYSNKCRDLLDPKELLDPKDFKDFADHEGFLLDPLVLLIVV